MSEEQVDEMTDRKETKLLTPEEMGVLQPDHLAGMVSSGRVSIVAQPEETKDGKTAPILLRVNQPRLAPVPPSGFDTNYNRALQNEVLQAKARLTAQAEQALSLIRKDYDKKILDLQNHHRDVLKSEIDALVACADRNNHNVGVLGEQIIALNKTNKLLVVVTAVLAAVTCGVVFGPQC